MELLIAAKSPTHMADSQTLEMTFVLHDVNFSVCFFFFFALSLWLFGSIFCCWPSKAKTFLLASPILVVADVHHHLKSQWAWQRVNIASMRPTETLIQVLFFCLEEKKPLHQQQKHNCNLIFKKKMKKKNNAIQTHTHNRFATQRL